LNNIYTPAGILEALRCLIVSWLKKMVGLGSKKKKRGNKNKGFAFYCAKEQNKDISPASGPSLL